MKDVGEGMNLYLSQSSPQKGTKRIFIYLEINYEE